MAWWNLKLSGVGSFQRQGGVWACFVVVSGGELVEDTDDRPALFCRGFFGSRM